MKEKASAVVGAGFLFIIIIALVIALWPSQELVLDADKIGLRWYDSWTLFTECYAENNSSEDWTGLVIIEIDNLEGKTLWYRTAEDWLDKKVESGKGAWVSTMIPFSDIEDGCTENTIIVRFLWGTQRVEKRFKI